MSNAVVLIGAVQANQGWAGKRATFRCSEWSFFSPPFNFNLKSWAIAIAVRRRRR